MWNIFSGAGYASCTKKHQKAKPSRLLFGFAFNFEKYVSIFFIFFSEIAWNISHKISKFYFSWSIATLMVTRGVRIRSASCGTRKKHIDGETLKMRTSVYVSWNRRFCFFFYFLKGDWTYIKAWSFFLQSVLFYIKFVLKKMSNNYLHH